MMNMEREEQLNVAFDFFCQELFGARKGKISVEYTETISRTTHFSLTLAFLCVAGVHIGMQRNIGHARRVWERV